MQAAIFYSVSFFFLGVVIAGLGPALPELIEERAHHNLTDGTTGLVVATRSGGYLLASIGSGILLDRFPAWGNRLIGEYRVDSNLSENSKCNCCFNLLLPVLIVFVSL